MLPSAGGNTPWKALTIEHSSSEPNTVSLSAPRFLLRDFLEMLRTVFWRQCQMSVSCWLCRRSCWWADASWHYYGYVEVKQSRWVVCWARNGEFRTPSHLYVSWHMSHDTHTGDGSSSKLLLGLAVCFKMSALYFINDDSMCMSSFESCAITDTLYTWCNTYVTCILLFTYIHYDNNNNNVEFLKKEFSLFWCGFGVLPLVRCNSIIWF